MFRSAVRAVLTVLFLASAVSAEIVDPVFVRGTKNLANGQFEHLEAFESASDMVKYQNQFWTQAMANPNYGKSAFFDGTNYYWVDHKHFDSFYLHDYGSDLNDLINDSGADTHIFHRTSPSDDGTGWSGTWFADSEGGIYNYFHPYINGFTDHATYVYRMRRYATIADVLSDNGTTYDSGYYTQGDRFFAVNGKYYRTNTDGDNVTGIDEYNSFDDLRNGNFSVRYNGGAGASHDLFMVVPRAALGLTGFHSPVPEIDPAGIGSALALLGGGLGLLERRRKRA
jgi:hypothetical protein